MRRAEKPQPPLDVHRHIVKLKKRFGDLTAIACCRGCRTPVMDAAHRYCYICGAQLPTVGRRSTMFYKSIRVTETGKALTCPHCDNEELTPGEFCMICGQNIVNKCADTPGKAEGDPVERSCRAVLPGNARYCPKCGNESSFYQKGWLRDWRSENTKRAIENINMSAVDIAELKQERKPG